MFARAPSQSTAVGSSFASPASSFPSHIEVSGRTWTLTETLTLMNGVERHGTHWESIANDPTLDFRSRGHVTGLQLKDRWYTLARKDTPPSVAELVEAKQTGVGEHNFMRYIYLRREMVRINKFFSFRNLSLIATNGRHAAGPRGALEGTADAARSLHLSQSFLSQACSLSPSSLSISTLFPLGYFLHLRSSSTINEAVT